MDEIKINVVQLEKIIEKKFIELSKKIIELEDKLLYSEMEKEKVRKSLRVIRKKLENYDLTKI